MKTNRWMPPALAVAVLAALPSFAAAQCCVTLRPQCQTVYMPEQVTRYRLVQETVMQPEQVTSYRPVWETSMTERRYTVAKPVQETSFREERYTVLRPQVSCEERQQVCHVVEYVNETSMREQRQIVMRPIYEQQVYQQQFTVRKPVCRTVLENEQYTVCQPVTTYRTEYVDQGQEVCQQVVVPGETRNRLRWLPGQYVTNPLTGTPQWQRGGLHWVPDLVTAARVETRRQWVPNLVAQQVPVTQMVPQVLTRQVAKQVTEYVDEVQTRDIPYTVCKWQPEEQVTQIPCTVQRPVTREVVNKYQVQVCNWQREEMVRRVPVTTCRVEYEERVEQIPVKTCKWVTETSTVMRPQCVSKWVEYTCTRMVPRTVMTSSACPTCTVAAAPPVQQALSYYAPGATTHKPQTSLKQPAESEAPMTQEAPADDAHQPGGASVLKPSPDLNAPGNGGAGEAPAKTQPRSQIPQPSQPYRGPLRQDLQT